MFLVLNIISILLKEEIIQSNIDRHVLVIAFLLVNRIPIMYSEDSEGMIRALSKILWRG